MPVGEGNEAYINMNNVMRQMGCQKQAFRYTWMQVKLAEQRHGAAGQTFIEPKALDCAEENDQEVVEQGTLSVVCVKYGTKYGADYVNKLYWGFKKHLTLPHTFSCFTEDSEGLDPEIKVIALKN